MTNKDNLQKELKEKIKEGLKPSHLKKLRKSKSLGDISNPSVSNVPLKKSQSQLEMPVNQPSQEQQIQQLQETVKFHAQTSQNYLISLQSAQAKITELEEELKSHENFVEAPEENISELKTKISQLEDQILELRLEKIKEFGDYYQKKQDLESELELNINEGVKEIQRLENKLIATNKKKLELAQKLGTAESKNAQLELQNLDKNPSPNYKLIILVISLYFLGAWLLSKNIPQKQE